MPTVNRASNEYALRLADSKILLAIGRFHCVTALQLTKLLYARSSHEWTQRKLKPLTEAGYLLRRRIPWEAAPGRGSVPIVYVLTQKAIRALVTLGHPPPSLPPPYRVERWTLFHIAHLLAVNEALIAAVQLTREVPTITLASLRHDQDLKRSPTRVRLPAGRTTAVAPDGFLDFEVHAGDGYRLPVCLEIDRGTHNRGRFREKVAALMAFSHGAYQQAFGRQYLTVAFITTAGDRRREAMQRWTEEILEELGADEADADLFRFAAFPLDWHIPEDQRPSPAALYLEPHWSAPFQRQPAPLIDEID